MATGFAEDASVADGNGVVVTVVGAGVVAVVWFAVGFGVGELTISTVSSESEQPTVNVAVINNNVITQIKNTLNFILMNPPFWFKFTIIITGECGECQ